MMGSVHFYRNVRRCLSDVLSLLCNDFDGVTGSIETMVGQISSKMKGVAWEVRSFTDRYRKGRKIVGPWALSPYLLNLAKPRFALLFESLNSLSCIIDCTLIGFVEGSEHSRQAILRSQQGKCHDKGKVTSTYSSTEHESTY